MSAAKQGTLPRARHARLSDERGMSMVFVSIGFMAFFAATTLAIDVGLFMTARAQAQNAADAGALSGAVAFVYNSYDDRSSGGPVVQSAINTALANKVVGGAVSVEPGDVTFPIGSNGTYNRVQVKVHRTTARLNAIPTLIGPIFGIDDFDITASATAEAAPASGIKCVKPFIIPDRWTENQSNNTFDRYDNKGNVLANADVYKRPGESGYNGYTEHTKGEYLQLRAAQGNNISPTMYYSWKMPGEIGGNFYEENISGCNPTVISPGTRQNPVVAQQEPGAMTGPTFDGIKALMAKDPNASWDPVSKTVVSEFGSSSPRLFPIPLYDPDTYQNGMQTGRNASLEVVSFLGFFLEGYDSSGIYGRVAGLTGVIDPNAPAAMPENGLIKAIRLVK
jgi:Flp pilus assembly protein TadG